jgi:hypothetical protein
MWLNAMTEINDISLRVDAQDNPFHSCDIGISQAKIGGKGYEGGARS